jgi:serine/threonine-protein kinase
VDAPATLELVILRCLEKDRDKRYGNVARLAVALRDFASSRGRQSVEAILRTLEASGQPLVSAAPAPGPAADLGVQTIEPFGKTQIPMHGGGKGKPLVIAGVVAAAALVVIGIIALRVAQSPAPASATLVTSSIAPVPAAPAMSGAANVGTGSPATAESAAPEMPPTAASGTAPNEAVAAHAAAPLANVTNAANAAKKAAPAPRPPPTPAKPKTNCDPNFYLDAQGEKHFKPECFR